MPSLQFQSQHACMQHFTCHNTSLYIGAGYCDNHTVNQLRLNFINIQASDLDPSDHGPPDQHHQQPAPEPANPDKSHCYRRKRRHTTPADPARPHLRTNSLQLNLQRCWGCVVRCDRQLRNAGAPHLSEMQLVGCERRVAVADWGFATFLDRRSGCSDELRTSASDHVNIPGQPTRLRICACIQVLVVTGCSIVVINANETCGQTTVPQTQTVTSWSVEGKQKWVSEQKPMQARIMC